MSRAILELNLKRDRLVNDGNTRSVGSQEPREQSATELVHSEGESLCGEDFQTGHCWATPTDPRPGGSSSFIEEWEGEVPCPALSQK